MRKIYYIFLICVIIISVIFSNFYFFNSKSISYTQENVIDRFPVSSNTSVFGCEKSYPDLCIPKGEIFLTCENVLEKSFVVKHDDPNNFDPDGNGLGCE